MRASRVDERSAAAWLVIERFVGRTLCYQARLRRTVDRLGLTHVDVQGLGVDDLCSSRAR